MAVHFLVRGARFTNSDFDIGKDNLRGDVALGDFNRDGHVDIVTVANWELPADAPLMRSPAAYGSVFDPTAVFSPIFAPSGAGFVWSGIDYVPGRMTVEINRGGDVHGSATMQPLGTRGLTRGGVGRGGSGPGGADRTRWR